MTTAGRHRSGVHIEQAAAALTIRYRSLPVWGAALLCVASAAPAAVIAVLVTPGDPDVVLAVGPWAVYGLVVIARTLVAALPTEIVVDADELRVTRRSPSRRPGTRRTALHDVTRAVVVRDRDDGRRTRRNNVHVYIRRIGSVPVLSSMPERDDAEAIRDALNGHLRALRDPA